MTKIAFLDLVAESNTVKWDRNWTEDSQLGQHSPEEYADIARTLRIEALRNLKAFLEKTPNAVIKDDSSTNPQYYSLTPHMYHNGVVTTSIDTLIDEIAQNDAHMSAKKKLIDRMTLAAKSYNSNDVLAGIKELQAFGDVIPDNRFLKSPERIAIKAKEYSIQNVPHPERIGDYLRFQILCDTSTDLVAARHEMQFGRTLNLTSQKDKLRRPDTEGGHRSFMAHINVEGQGQSLRYEVMLSLYQAETFSVDKAFRYSERTSQEMASKYSTDQAGLSNAYYAAANVLQQLRKISFYNLYGEIEGMNDLLDPDIDVDGICKNAETTSKFNVAACSKILERLGSVVNNFPNLFSEDRRPH